MRSAGGVGVKGESMPRSAVGRVGARAVPEAPDRHPGDSTVATDWIFSRRLRWGALVWMAVSLPVVVVASGAATSAEGYLLVFAVVASGLYTTPALVHTWLAARRAPRPDNLCWWLWLSAVVLMYGVGCAMVTGVTTGLRVPTAVNAVVIGIIAVLLMTSIVLMVRARSGGRATSIDLIESVMSVIVVAAPAALVFGERVLEAEDHWYAVPASLAVPCMVFGVYWAVLLVTRLEGQARRAVVVGLILAVGGVADARGAATQG